MLYIRGFFIKICTFDISTYSASANILNYCKNKWPNIMKITMIKSQANIPFCAVNPNKGYFWTLKK